MEADEVCDDVFNPDPPIGACNRECTGFYQIKSILLTEEAFGSDLGGISGADDKCASEFGAGWRALLVGGGRRATVTPFAGDGQVNWVLDPYTHYFNEDGFLIWRTDEIALLAVRDGAYSPMLSPIFRGDAFGPSFAWSGYSGDWVTVPDGANAGGTCLGWTDVQGANIGASARSAVFMQGEFSERSITTTCGTTTLQLLCVEP